MGKTETDTKNATEKAAPPRSSFSVNEICHRNNVGRTLLYSEMNAGRLGYISIGTIRRITTEQEKAWHSRLAVSAAA